MKTSNQNHQMPDFFFSQPFEFLSPASVESYIVVYVIVSGLYVIITKASHPFSAVRKMAKPAK